MSRSANSNRLQTPIDYAKLEAGLADKNAAISDEFGKIERQSTADMERQKKELQDQVKRAKDSLDDANAEKGQVFNATPISNGQATARWILFAIGGGAAIGCVLLWRQCGGG